MPRLAPTFAGWGLSMPTKAWHNCDRCQMYVDLLFFRRQSGAWLCRGCARAPHTPLGQRWG